MKNAAGLSGDATVRNLMNKLATIAGLTIAMLLLGGKLSLAAEGAPQSGPEAAGKTIDISKREAAVKANIAARRKAAAKIKRVDVNSASAAQLMKLPYITAADADKIIAGRPYKSKAWLVTNGIIGEGPYTAISGLIKVGPPKKEEQKGAPAKK